MARLFFYFFGTVAVLSSLFVIILPRPTRALLSLIAAMFALAVIYLLLGAEFLAMVNLIVYAGAVLVLFLFVIMLQGTGATDIPLFDRFRGGYLLAVLVTATAFMGCLQWVLNRAGLPEPAVKNLGSIESIAEPLFRDYLLPFELTSLVLLLGVFAAVALAKDDPLPSPSKNKEKGRS